MSSSSSDAVSEPSRPSGGCDAAPEGEVLPPFFLKCSGPAFVPGVPLGSISIGVIVLPVGVAADSEAGLAIALKKAE